MAEGNVFLRFGETAPEVEAQIAAAIAAMPTRQIKATGQTTDDTPLALTGDATYPITLANNTTATYIVMVTGRKINTTGANASYIIKGGIKRDANAGTTALVGSPAYEVLAEDNPDYDVVITADTSGGGFTITVTGDTGATVNWVASGILTIASGAIV